MTMLSTAALSRLLPLPIVFALLFAPLQTLSDTAYACSCLQTTVVERVENADVVAIGTVVSVFEDQTTEGLGSGMLIDMDGVVRVSTYYKGSGPHEIAVDDPPDSGTCGVITERDIGQEIILFLWLDAGEYLTHLCSGSHFTYGNEDLRAEAIAEIEAVTGPGQPPEGSPPQASPPPEEPESPEDDHTESTPWAVVLPLAFAIPLAVLVIPAFLRRRGGR